MRLSIFLSGVILIIAIIFFAFSLYHSFLPIFHGSYNDSGTLQTSSVPLVSSSQTKCYSGGVGLSTFTDKTNYLPGENVTITYGMYGNLWNTRFNVTTAIFGPDSSFHATFSNASIVFLGPICPPGPDGTPDHQVQFVEKFTLPSTAATGSWKIYLTLAAMRSNQSQVASATANFVVDRA